MWMTSHILNTELDTLETRKSRCHTLGFQSIKQYIQYLASHTHNDIFYPSNSYYGSNVIIFRWSVNKVEDYTTHNCLELHQDADTDIFLNRRYSVSGIIHTFLGVSILCKVQIQLDTASDYTDG